MTISIVWLAIPSFIRFAILIILFLLIFRKPILFLFGKTVSLIILILKSVIVILFYTFEKILILFFKIFGSVLNSINHFFEEVRFKIMGGIDKIKTRWSLAVMKKDKWVKPYKRIAYMLTILLSFFLYQWPEHTASKFWFSHEDRILREKLHIDVISVDSARSELFSWTDRVGNQEVNGETVETPIQLKLAPAYDGGNIRAEAANNANIVTSIGPNEIIVFLDETSIDNNGVRWFKVKTSQGHVGWISSNIVQQI